VPNYPKSARMCVVVFTCAAALIGAACGSTESSPTGPSSPAAAPSPPPVEPGSPGALSVSISPNPVPWSSDPVPNCNLANRWHYEQTLKNAGGTRMTISDRVDFFDGVEVSKRSGLAIVLDPDQDSTITTSWCSANNIEHRVQTNFSGSDDSGNRVTFTGTTVRLQRKP
jgi:hypothetical protein